jgi:hypothetical protein
VERVRGPPPPRSSMNLRPSRMIWYSWSSLKVSESVLNLHSLHLRHEVHQRGKSIPKDSNVRKS